MDEDEFWNKMTFNKVHWVSLRDWPVMWFQVDPFNIRLSNKRFNKFQSKNGYTAKADACQGADPFDWPFDVGDWELTEDNRHTKLRKSFEAYIERKGHIKYNNLMLMH